MKKKTYIAPEIVEVVIGTPPLLTGSPFTEGETAQGGGLKTDDDYEWDEEHAPGDYDPWHDEGGL